MAHYASTVGALMNIRSFTVGAAMPQGAGRASLISSLGSFAISGRATLRAAGLTVQTTRLSAQPAERWLDPQHAAHTVGEWAAACSHAGLDYCSIGTIKAVNNIEDGAVKRLLDILPDILMSTQSVFASVQVGAHLSSGSVIDLDAVRACARIMHTLASQTPDGFGNLRFAAAANCPPHIPFFPASYYIEDEQNAGGPEFGLALEAADLAVQAFTNAHSQEEARGNLLALLVEHAGKAAEICVKLESEHGYHFTGLDISMAPYPEPDRSIGRALEMLSGAPLGSPGTLAAAAFFTDILREASSHLPTVGYSGLMLPALEDQTLADRAAEGLVTIDTLLLMSAVCGLGLDTVPLPGDVSPAQLERIILDTASLAVRLDKPLTARLMPVPGKMAGEPAEWPDFPYFAKGKVMYVPQLEPNAGGLLNGKRIQYQ